MAKFIKEVTKEVLDVEGIQKALQWHKAMSAKPIRVVMSPDTECELAVCLGYFRIKISSVDGKRVGTKTFMGCPIDHNNDLSFGEVLFTVEL